MTTTLIRRKRSVSFRPDLDDRIAESSRRSGLTYSGWLAETAEWRLRVEDGLRAVAQWEAENGTFTAQELVEGRELARRLLHPSS
ncbi:MAG TPA: hypothetical protein VNQ73_24190 [Ilumatobacter sp.]|nr:hypothetical protein [Ilumatobacter sp.]